MTDSCARPLDLSRLYRANASAATRQGNQRTIYVEADDEREARFKIVTAMAVIEDRPPIMIEKLIYNIVSARQCMQDAAEPGDVSRLFELDPQGFFVVSEPIFLLSEPAALIRKWIERVKQP